MVEVKICGINDEAALQVAVEGGARYVGLVFYPLSPRVVNVESARKLAALAPPHVTVVGLFVDPRDDDFLAAKSVPFGMIQLHGKETASRVAEVRTLTGLPVMKAVGIASAADFEHVEAYEMAADMLLFDAKPSSAARLPGGNAESFDWSLMRHYRPRKPWMLGGGLNAGNLAEAVKKSRAQAVDVSSGVEDAPGRKNPVKIQDFLATAARL